MIVWSKSRKQGCRLRMYRQQGLKVVLAASSIRPQNSCPCNITGHDRCGVLRTKEAAAVARS